MLGLSLAYRGIIDFPGKVRRGMGISSELGIPGIFESTNRGFASEPSLSHGSGRRLSGSYGENGEGRYSAVSGPSASVHSKSA